MLVAIAAGRTVGRDSSHLSGLQVLPELQKGTVPKVQSLLGGLAPLVTDECEYIKAHSCQPKLGWGRKATKPAAQLHFSHCTCCFLSPLPPLLYAKGITKETPCTLSSVSVCFLGNPTCNRLVQLLAHGIGAQFIGNIKDTHKRMAAVVSNIQQ